MANSMNGTGAPPAAQINGGDLLALTTNTALTSGGNAVCRMLLPADKTLHYKQGTPVAGILGAAWSPVASSSVGQPQGGATTPGGVQYAAFGDTSLYGLDKATGRGYVGSFNVQGATVFRARLDLNYNDWPNGLTLQHQFDNQLAGVIFNFNTYLVNFSSTSTLVIGGTVTGTTLTGGSATSTLGTTTTAAQALAALQLAAVTAGFTTAQSNAISVTGTTGGPLTVYFPLPVFLFPGTSANATVVGQGPITYTVQPGTGVGSVVTGAAALDECLGIIGPEETDPGYNSLIAVSQPGPFVLVQIVGSFDQSTTRVMYSTN